MSTEKVTEARKSKIPAVRVPSDDCVVRVGRIITDGEITVDGTPYDVHKGEYVEIIPMTTLAEVIALGVIANPDTSEEAAAVIVAKSGKAMDDLCQALATRIVGWDWTDMTGNLLPNPYGRPEVLKALTTDELIWLIGASKGETPEQRKNA